MISIVHRSKIFKDICRSSKSHKRKAALDTESPTARLEASAKKQRLDMNVISESNESEKHERVKCEFRRSGRTIYAIGQMVHCRLRGKWEKATIQAFLPDGRISVQYLGSKEVKEVTRAYLHDAHSAPPSRTWTAKSVTANKQQSIPANDDVIDLTISSSSDESGDFNECL